MYYIHDVRYLETGEPFDVIRTKARFRKRMINYYFEEGGSERLMFKLLESPNTAEYEIIPYINRRGNPSICFTRITDIKDQDRLPQCV